MPDRNDIDRVWDIIEKNSIGMLTTLFAGGLRARPVDARPDRAAGAIYFVTDVRGHKDDEIAAKPDVCFVVVVPKDNVYLSITGRATVTRNPAKARAITSKFIVMNSDLKIITPHLPSANAVLIERFESPSR